VESVSSSAAMQQSMFAVATAKMPTNTEKAAAYLPPTMYLYRVHNYVTKLL
jgi:hypothetical protein